MRLAAPLTALVTLGLLAGALEAQQSQPVPRRAQPKPNAIHVIVRDVSGSPLRGATVVIAGPTTLEITTDADGTASLPAMSDGPYHFRFEHDGYLPMERDITIRNGQPPEIYAALRIVPSAPAPPPPPPPPTPVAPPAPAPVVSGPSRPPVFVAIPAFLEKNYIGREPLKESILGCLAGSTTRLLQLHDAIAEHTHADTDEILYIVAGEGTVRLRSDSSSVAAGSLSIIPRGLPHALDRRGKNALIAISILSGAPCPAGESTEAATKK